MRLNSRKKNVDMKQEHKVAEPVKLRQLRQALAAGVSSILLCCAMLAGTTYAWLTEVVSSAEQTIQSGNMAVELRYRKSLDEEWKSIFLTGVKETALVENLFSHQTWQPGDAEYIFLEIRNAGTLPVSYQLMVEETSGVMVAELEEIGTATPSVAFEESVEGTLEWLYAGYSEEWWYEDYGQATPSNAEMIELVEANETVRVSDGLIIEGKLPAAEWSEDGEAEVPDLWGDAAKITLVLYMLELDDGSLLSTTEEEEHVKGTFTIHLEARQLEDSWEETIEELSEELGEDEDFGIGPGMEAEGN